MPTPKFFEQGDSKNRDLLKKPLSAVLCGFFNGIIWLISKPQKPLLYLKLNLL